MSRPDVWKDCTKHCERMPRCPRCDRRKQPVGRDIAAADNGSYCKPHECEAYWDEPTPGHLWPGELERIKES